MFSRQKVSENVDVEEEIVNLLWVSMMVVSHSGQCRH